MERYESLGLVGEGSYGTVTKCRHRESGRIVAVKRFLESEEDKSVKKIALREIRLLKQLRHENLVNLLEVWKKKRRWYLVFEFVERTVLDELEQFPNGLEPNRVRKYLYQILRAISFCHQHHIIHRDVKPENVLVSQQGVVKLCDFGFARTMAAPGEVYTDYVATRWYRAPELLVGDAKYDKAVDVWATGCLFVEMMTGVPLFPGDSDIDQLYHIIRCLGSLTSRQQEIFYRNPLFSGVRLPEPTDREPLHTRFPQLTGSTADLTQKCLQMDPEKRAQSSQLLLHDFFTRDGFHIRFHPGSASKAPKNLKENPRGSKSTKRERGDVVKQKRDETARTASDDIIQREKLDTEERNGVTLKDSGLNDPNKGPLRAGSERGETTHTSISNKHTLEDTHTISDKSATAFRPSELTPKNCPAPIPAPGIPTLPHSPLTIITNAASTTTGPPLSTISLRSVEKSKRSVNVCNRFSQQSLSHHLSAAPTGQVVPERSVCPERSFQCKGNAAGNAGKRRGEIRFPELRNTLLPERRTDGKHSKKKDTRIPSITTADLHLDRNI
ncbi:cyclin-dependent kinase-like 4 [Salminus brasiliensis]|uniref:cyclin-dependent kinase-like 4 n=1 Tax=Salminus brasiliensis TaxID=930266 RepID=UPI003B82D52C